MYILSRTRRYSSMRSSQRGIRCGVFPEACCGTGTEPFAEPGAGAGRGTSDGDLSSCCWDILRLRPAPPYTAQTRAFSTGTPYCNGNTAGCGGQAFTAPSRDDQAVEKDTGVDREVHATAGREAGATGGWRPALQMAGGRCYRCAEAGAKDGWRPALKLGRRSRWTTDRTESPFV